MTAKEKAAIEEAAKLPTAYQTLNHHLSRVGLTLATAHESILLDAVESHTAAHTAALQERVKELEATLSINRYTLEDMRKSFYAGHSLCDDEWRGKRKLTGFDEFIDSLK